MQAFDGFSPATAAWFDRAFAAPTEAQIGAWRAISAGDHTLVVAPTGSGKTLAAFLWSIDRYANAPTPPKKERLRVLYISPLKALAVDVERNLRSPLHGIASGDIPLETSLSVGVRTGDTPADERRRMVTAPPDVLITTPESLFLMLTSQAREMLRHVEVVIIDEIHALAASKRGTHLMLSLERLDALLARPAQRVGLSATVRPMDEVATLLAGGRPVTVVQAAPTKRLDLKVVVPIEDMTTVGESSPRDASAGPEARTTIWTHVDPALVEMIRAHRSTIVFCNARRLAERLCARINDEAGEIIARAHHGSVSREQRLQIEEDLKTGALPCVVATSSLELGIDMGLVDLVVQVEAPPSVASGMQRIGRAGHQVNAISRGVIMPKFRGDLVECAVVTERMNAGEIEHIRFPRNALDVLAQQIVAMVAMDELTVDEVADRIARAAPYTDLPRSALEGVLDMLAGRYPSDAFSELRPRLNWDRASGRLTARPGAQKLAVANAGTITDRGLYAVYLATEKGPRLGELDEEMVHESRAGDVFTLGATSWRIEDITHDRVFVSPAPGIPGKMPFWRGDRIGRPVELGMALGAFQREIGALGEKRATARLRDGGLDEWAAGNLVRYLAEQKAATGVIPSDRVLVLERFRDEMGDWRLCIHSPLGARVHAPWAEAIRARIRERLDLDVQTLYDDDGIVVRLPDTDDAPSSETVLFDPDEIEEMVLKTVSDSSLFAGRFRECAGRALLLPRRRPGERTPLWRQRQKAADLLRVASSHPQFPIVLEAYREVLQEAFDMEALKDLMRAISTREVTVVDVETASPSPFATSLTFGYVGAFLYDGDTPLAERRAQALSIDRRMLAELLGAQELRDLVDPGALADLELELQRLLPHQAPEDIDQVHDLLRALGDLSADEAVARGAKRSDLDALVADRRALRLTIAGEERFVMAEDAARYRDALGTALPVGVADAFLEPVADALGDLIARYARTHGPFHARDAAARFAIGVAVVERALETLAEAGRVTEGAFRPDGTEQEWIDTEVLRRLRRRSLAAFRSEIEPVGPDALARFLPAWQGVGNPRAGIDGVLAAIETLQGAFVPASALETQVLRARVQGEIAPHLDTLTASGEIVWAGGGALGSEDGYVTLCPRDLAPLLLPEPTAIEDDLALRLRDVLAARGAMFFREAVDALGSTDDAEVLRALWDLVWAGHATNDTLAPLRSLLAGGARTRRTGGARAKARPPLPTRLGPPVAAGRWSLLPQRAASETARAHALTDALLRRHGVLTRGSLNTERVPGGFASLYPVLRALEDAGRCARGYYVEGLGGAQFAPSGAVDRLRARAEDATTVVLAATDPANPFGAALPWPEDVSTHRPGRKAGAHVVLIDGALAAYLEKGGRSLLTYGDPEPAIAALAAAGRAGLLTRTPIERHNGAPLDHDIGEAFARAGFVATTRGYRSAHA
jgi:ATP-dependent helicase Lhr and Lhr-like helicase